MQSGTIKTKKEQLPLPKPQYEEENLKKSPKDKTVESKIVTQVKGDKAIKNSLKDHIKTLKNNNDFNRFLSEKFFQDKTEDGKNFSLLCCLAQKNKIIYGIDLNTLLPKNLNKEKRDKALFSLADDSTLDTIKRKQAASKIQDTNLKNIAWATIARDCTEDINNCLSLIKYITDDKVKDEVYLHILHTNNLGLHEKLNIIKEIQDRNQKEQILKSIAQDTNLQIHYRMEALKEVHNTQLRDSLIQSILDSHTIDSRDLTQIVKYATDTALKDRILLAIAQDTQLGQWERLETINKINHQDLKNKGYLAIVQDRKLRVNQRLETISKITDATIQNQAKLAIVADSKIDYNTRLKQIESTKNIDFRNQARLALVRDTSLIWEIRKQHLEKINKKYVRNQAHFALAQDTGLSLSIREYYLAGIQNLGLKDECLYHIIKDNSISNDKRFELAQSITDEDIRDISLISIAQDLSASPSIRITAAAAVTESNARERAYSSIIQDSKTPLLDRFNVYYWIKDPEILHQTGKALCQDFSINSDYRLYQAFLVKNQSYLVMDSMFASLEGLNDQSMEAVRLKKVAAAQALLMVDHYDQEAQLINYYFQNPGPDSPYTLYKTVLAKSQEVFPIGRALSDLKKLNSQEQLFFTEQAFNLPKVLDASWQDDFNSVNFDFFYKMIQEGCHSYREQAQSIQAQDENVKLEQEWLTICTGVKQATLRQALNTRDSASSNGNRIKKIALVIKDLFSKKNYDKAFFAINNLVFNLQTCEGGQQQAIEAAYMSILNVIQEELTEPNTTNRTNQLQKNDFKHHSDSLLKAKEKEKVLNVLYRIRQNYVLENERESIQGELYIMDHPQNANETFLHHLLQITGLSTRDIEIGHEGLVGNAKNAFNNTHIGININAIAGLELGLRAPESHPPYDPNLYAAAKFVNHPTITKGNILKAFMKAFSFDTIHETLGKRLWQALAIPSALPYNIFEDEACEQVVTLNSPDPISKGPEAFLKNIGIETKEFHQYFDYKTYYYIDTSFGKPEVAPISLNTGFSKKGLVNILQELDLLEDPQTQ